MTILFFDKHFNILKTVSDLIPRQMVFEQLPPPPHDEQTFLIFSIKESDLVLLVERLTNTAQASIPTRYTGLLPRMSSRFKKESRNQPKQ